MTRLDRLDVHGFRGLVESSLPFNCGSIVLGGANGTGKSAFVDAVEFLYTGSIAGLAGTAGLSLRQHGPHILASPGDSLVRADFDAPHASVTRWLTGAVDVPGVLDGHLTRGRTLTFILRRSQLQHFIHAKPADRYRSLSELVGVDVLDRTELALKRARDTLQEALASSQATLATFERQLDTPPDEIEDDEDLLRTVNATLREVGFSDYQLESLDDIASVRASLLRTLTERRADPRLGARARLVDELRRGINEQSLRDALSSFVAMVPAERDSGDRALGLDLLNTLRHGRDFLRRAEVHRCPLCEQHVDARALRARLMKRVAELEDLSLHQERLDRARDALEAGLRETAARVVGIEALQREAEIQDTSAAAVRNSVVMVQETLRAGTPTESLEMADRLENALERWVAWARDTEERLTSERPAQENGEDTETLDRVLALLQDVAVRRSRAERAKQERERLRGERAEISISMRRRERALALAEAAYRTFNAVKNAEIQRIYDELQSDLARFYDALHPGEGYSQLAVEMDPRKRGSSELRLGFHGRQEEDPRAFSSDGHLDSLGLCIFLAFVKRFNDDWPLLVLDDVVSSVDAAHKARVSNLLFEEFGDRQLLITTHDSRWFNDLRRAQEDTGHAADTRNLIIESWTLEQGPSIRMAS